MEVPADNGKDSSRKDGLKQLKDDKKDATEKKSKEQRVEFISLLLLLDVICACMCTCFLIIVYNTERIL